MCTASEPRLLESERTCVHGGERVGSLDFHLNLMKPERTTYQSYPRWRLELKASPDRMTKSQLYDGAGIGLS
jgi:hypothetical protein